MSQKPSSLRDRITEFFCTNPDEELTPQDAAIKFAAPLKSVQSALSDLSSMGVLARQNVYKLRDANDSD